MAMVLSGMWNFHSQCERSNRLTRVFCFRWRQSGQRPCLIRSIELFIVGLGLMLLHEMGGFCIRKINLVTLSTRTVFLLKIFNEWLGH